MRIPTLAFIFFLSCTFACNCTLLALSRPTITSPSTAGGKIGITYDNSTPLYTIVATESPFWFSHSGALPSGLFLDSLTGNFVGNTWENGTYEIVCYAENAAGVSDGLLVTMTIADSVPVITSSLTVEGTAGTIYTEAEPLYVITATENPNWFTADNLPDGLYLYSVSGAIAGFTESGGTFEVEISASNQFGRTGYATLTMEIAVPESITYTVTNTSASPAVSGSLAWAIQQANSHGIPAVIDFNIPGEGPHNIVLGDILWVNKEMTIDARTQPGYSHVSNVPLIRMDVGELDSGIIVAGGGDTTIAGLHIHNFGKNAIAITPGSDNVVVTHNYIGFYWDGSQWWRNFEAKLPGGIDSPLFLDADGIGIQSSYNRIEHNVISGVCNGISIGYDWERPEDEWGPVCQDNEIYNNFIGTTPDGDAILTNTPGALSYWPDLSDPVGTPDEWALFGNKSDGIYLAARVSGTRIGSNLCSGNYSAGIELLHDTVVGSIVYGNKCGTDVTGNVPLPNGELGMILSNGANRNIVGGSYGANLFSGNILAGVVIGGEGSYRSGIENLIQGNVIGCNVDTTASLGIQETGVYVGTVESYDNRIVENIVCGNDFGIYLEDTADNTVAENSVGTLYDSGIQEWVAMGNDRDGIVVDNSFRNVVIMNTVMFNGFDAPGADEGRGIWNFNGSSDNVYSGNVIENNKNPTNTTSCGPYFYGETSARGIVGAGFHFDIYLTEAPETLYASNLPAGLSLDVQEQAIKGIPTLAGVFTVELTASNQNGTNTAGIAFEIGSIKLNDLDGDGKPDILWRQSSTGIHTATIMDGLAAGGTAWLGGNTDWRIVATPDFNGDGKADLLWRQVSTGCHTATLMDGLTMSSSSWLGGNTDWQIVATPDFNGDGKSDLLWRQASTGYHTATLMDGLTIGSSSWLGGNTDWPIVTTLDLNGDGKADLLWRQASTGYHTATLMDGLTVGSSGWLGGNTDWRVIATPDFDGDGKADLLWRQVSTGCHTATLMDGLTPGSSAWLGGNTDWPIVATPDLNGDGKSDLLWRQVSTGCHTATLMDGSITGDSAWLGGNTDWPIVGTPDFNGDGKSDLLWQQASTGYHTATLMDGLTVGSSGWLGGDLEWQIVATLN